MRRVNFCGLRLNDRNSHLLPTKGPTPPPCRPACSRAAAVTYALLADVGIVDVPEDAPLPPGWPDKPQRAKKKRPRKPKPKHNQQEQKQIRRPISFLPALTEAIVGGLAQTEEQYDSVATARHKICRTQTILLTMLREELKLLGQE